MTVRLSGDLGDFVAANVGEKGSYQNVSEYIRDLIRRDKERVEQEVFDRLRAELALAFSMPDATYKQLTGRRSHRPQSGRMTVIRVQEAASLRLDEIYQYTRNRWGVEQADRYITGMFGAFEKIESHDVASRPIPAEFGVVGFFFRYGHHFIYWRRLSNGDIGIVTVLHERMHQIQRFRDDFGIDEWPMFEWDDETCESHALGIPAGWTAKFRVFNTCCFQA